MHEVIKIKIIGIILMNTLCIAKVAEYLQIIKSSFSQRQMLNTNNWVNTFSIRYMNLSYIYILVILF